MPETPRSLPGFFPDELERLVAEWGEPAYRARQIFQWIHRRGVLDPHQMTDLPAALRERIQVAQSEEVRRLKSVDGLTSKLLLHLRDGQEIEAVEMKTAQAGHGGREVPPGAGWSELAVTADAPAEDRARVGVERV